MKRRQQAVRGKAALDLIEEAFQLLRTVPVGVYASYGIGAVPFALGFLFFWADMSRGAFAHEWCVEEALALALLYLWMKGWQAGFASQLRARVAGAPPPSWTRSRVMRLAISQTIAHPYIFVALPAAAIMTIPFAWVYAYFHNVTCLGDGEEDDLRKLAQRCWRQAALWPGQNHLLIVIFWSFGLVVFINVAVIILLIPYLIRMFTGMESVFTLSGFHILNTTFFAAAGALTYLCINPMIQAVYVIRCFYGESLHSGADLRADLLRIEKEAAR